MRHHSASFETKTQLVIGGNPIDAFLIYFPAFTRPLRCDGTRDCYVTLERKLVNYYTRKPQPRRLRSVNRDSPCCFFLGSHVTHFVQQAL